jgi:3',5'-cyclic AMP phosphodiesterase CpdA
MSTDTRPIDSLLHLTDFHFWEVVVNPFQLLNKRFIGNANVWYRRRKEFLMANAGPHAEEALKTGITQAILSGDFTSTSTPAEFEAGAAFTRKLRERGLDLFVLPGNHDVYTFESLRQRRFEYYFDDWIPSEDLPVTQTLSGGTPLVMVPTVCPNFLSSRGRITDAEAESVATLVSGGDSPLVVTGHYPVLTDTHGYSTKPSRALRNADALREALGSATRPILYVSGHVHRSSYTRDPRHEHVAHLTTGAFFREAHETESHGEFSEIHIHDDGFRVVRHRLYDAWRTEELAIHE